MKCATPPLHQPYHPQITTALLSKITVIPLVVELMLQYYMKLLSWEINDTTLNKIKPDFYGLNKTRFDKYCVYVCNVCVCKHVSKPKMIQPINNYQNCRNQKYILAWMLI